MLDNMIVLYDWSQENDTIKTNKGNMLISEYFEREKKRIMQDVNRKVMIEYKGNYVRFLVDDIAGSATRKEGSNHELAYVM